MIFGQKLSFSHLNLQKRHFTIQYPFPHTLNEICVKFEAFSSIFKAFMTPIMLQYWRRLAFSDGNKADILAN